MAGNWDVDFRSSTAGQVNFVQEVIAAFAVVAIPQILSIPHDPRRVHAFRRMALQHSARRWINFVQCVTPIVRHPQVAVCHAQVPRLVVGRDKIVQHRSGGVYFE